jgi:hypothetical protein
LGKLAKPTQGPFKIIDIQQLPINGTILIQWLPTSVEHINIRWLLPFFEHYNWGCECCTPVIMPYSHSIQHIQQISKWALPNSRLQPRETHSLRLSICKLFTKTHLIHMTTSEESLWVLFFTHSLAIDLVH